MRRAWWVWRSAEGGYLTLIGLLVVIVIIGIMFAMMYGGGGGGGGSSGIAGSPTTTLGGAKQRAQDVVCRNGLSQIRAALNIYQGSSGYFPPSLESVQSGVALTCPVGGERYQYDPGTGQVRCVHPGHERY